MTSPGAITASIDVAQVVLYMFWIFFAGLIYYLHREDKREGYPMESDGRRGTRVAIQGFPAMPSPKTFRLASGELRTVPRPELNTPLSARPLQAYPGAPLVPVGDPMTAGVGPGSISQRADRPDVTVDGTPRLVPLRAAPGCGVASQDPDPRGMAVRGADGEVGGTVRDLWLDQAEALFRYLEVEVAGGRRVLLPINFARIGEREVRVASVLGRQFAGVPATRAADVVTLLEEERVMAYYGAGTLYAEPGRQEPLV